MRDPVPAPDGTLLPDYAHAEASISFRDALLTIVPDLRAFGRSLASDADTADDLVQETLVRAWAAHRTFDPSTNIRAWTFTILRNAHYSRWHKTKREIAWDPDLDHRLSSPAAQEAGIAFADLHRALQSLPVTQREALILVGAAGWTYEEAAAICACQPGTIKSRVSRARTAILAFLAVPAGKASQTRPSSEAAFSSMLGEIDSSVSRHQALSAVSRHQALSAA